MDQLISQSPGLIAQMRGRPTHQRYKCTSVYVDPFTNYTFTYLQKSTTVKETIKGKRLIERHMERMGHKVTHYHADNGVFASHAWRKHCSDNSQQLTFAVSGTHHMNEVAEAKINHLQSLARTMMIHANQQWPTAINANLWPYAIRMATNVMNSTPPAKIQDIQTPWQAVERTNVTTNVKHGTHLDVQCAHYKDPSRVATSLTNGNQGQGWGSTWVDHPNMQGQLIWCYAPSLA